MIYQFKVNLKNVGIPVWRRMLIKSNTTFEEMNYIIMAAFDWLGYHLHEFDIRKSNGRKVQNLRIGALEDDSFVGFGMSVSLNEKKETLADWFKKEKDRGIYTYDFGDNWEHEIVLERILNEDPRLTYPLCIKAKNDSPPDDSRLEIINNEIDLANPGWKMIVEFINGEYHTEGWMDNFIKRDDFI